MQFVANYEIKSTMSVTKDNLWLKFQHPKGLYRVRLQNIVREDFSVPFLLSLHLSFDASSLNEAPEVADELLADCLNMLAFTTSSTFKQHRILQIVDCTPDLQMRPCLMWGDSVGHEDPSPFLDEKITNSISGLLTFDMPPLIRKAMRWYRIGIQSTIPDDQFQYFWFALELIANFQKSSEKVPDQCPHCKSPLYCEACKTYPQHKPYIKQAILALIKKVDDQCDEATIKMLGDTRNALMHGSTLREIEGKLPSPHEEIVDILGRIVFKVILHQFPPDIFTDQIVFAQTSTYVHQTLTGVAQIQTIVPIDEYGDFDLSFSGMSIKMITDGPPQSAMPFYLVMSLEQRGLLSKISYENGDHQELCRRIYQRSQIQGDQVVCIVLATDMKRILNAIESGETGNWQDLFRVVMGQDYKPQLCS